MRIASLPRATPDVLWVALYIDAGSRDAEVPETATLSAWLAAKHAGGDVTATVFPDVTELSVPCAADALSQCVELLVQALTARAPEASDLAAARTQLRDSQRRALAADPRLPLDALAMEALLGRAATGFFPLGSVETDLVAAGEAVASFLRRHYGPERALLIAAGDIGPNELMRAATQAVHAAPAAQQARAARSLVPRERPELAVTFDDQPGAALAIAGPDEKSLRDVTRKLSDSLAEEQPQLGLTGHVFAARSGAIALLRLTATDHQRALQRASRALARMQREPPPALPPEVQPDDLRSSARALGLEFGGQRDAGVGAQATPASPNALHFGAALALEAGPDGGPADSARRAQREQQRRERAQAWFNETIAQADPALHGDIDRYVAAVQLDNGAHIDVQYTQTDSVAVAIRIGGGAGAANDPPSVHGKAALLATLTSMYCAGMSPELLHERFAQLGATLTPRVNAESYGLLLRVPQAHFEEATELALRCLRAPSRDPAHLIEAGVRLQQRLRSDDQRLAMRARAAELISPTAPGPLAPWGDPNRVPNLHPPELARTLRENQRGARWAIGVVGPIDVQRSTHWLARRIADLAPEPDPVPPHWDEPATSLPEELPRSRDRQGPTLIAVWAANGDYDGTLGAQLFARALAAVLGALPGVEVLWREADSYKQTHFAALALRIRPDLLPSAPTWLSDAAHSIDDVWLERALDPAVADAQRASNAAQAEIAVRAEQIARLRLGAAFERASVDSARAQLLALRQARPGFAATP